MMKKLVIFLILLVLISSFVIAEFDLRKGYTWLRSEGSQGNYDNNAMNSAMAAIALKDFDVDEAWEAISWLNSNKNNNDCWPKTSCKVKDSSLVIWAMDEFEEDITENLEWLENAETASTFGGNWYLQVVTSGSGECSIRYMKNSVEVERIVEVDGGKFPGYGNSNWLNLNSNLEAGLLTNYPSLELDIDCTDISSSTIVSILFNEGNSYYIIDEVHSNQATMSVENSCYGVGYKSSCNYESTLYANWVLSKLNRDIKSRFYLEQNYDENNAIHSSLLYLMTQEEKYKITLEENKRRDGSWNNNVYSTAVALLALGSQEDSLEWLKDKQRGDGSWNGNVVDTAIVLIGGFYGEIVDTIDDEEAVCDEDDICEPDRGEDADNCPEDCLVDEDEGEEGEDYDTGVCIVNGECETEVGEDYYNCPEDCPYEEEDYGEDEEDYGEEPIYEEEGGEGFPWTIIWILLLLIIIGLGGYVYYTKYYLKRGVKPKGEKPGFNYSSFLNRRGPKTELDERLEKSISDLKKLK